MTSNASAARTLLRCSAVGVTTALVGLGGVAFADTPTNWEDSPSVSGFQFLLVLFLIPAGLAIVITALTVIPSLVKGTNGEIEIAKQEPDRDVTRTH